MNPDLVNALFEFFAAAVGLLNIRQLLKDKEVKGVSIWPVIFFITWGLWNLYYYPSLEQVWSSIGAFAMLGVNSVWLVIVLIYRKESEDVTIYHRD